MIDKHLLNSEHQACYQSMVELADFVLHHNNQIIAESIDSDDLQKVLERQESFEKIRQQSLAGIKKCKRYASLKKRD